MGGLAPTQTPPQLWTALGPFSSQVQTSASSDHLVGHKPPAWLTFPLTCHSSQASPCNDCHLWDLVTLTHDFGSSDHLKATGAQHLTSHSSIMTGAAGVGGGPPLYRWNREAGPRLCPASHCGHTKLPSWRVGSWAVVGPPACLPSKVSTPAGEGLCTPAFSPYSSPSLPAPLRPQATFLCRGHLSLQVPLRQGSSK